MQGDLDAFIDILSFAIEREQAEREAREGQDEIPNFVVILTEINEKDDVIYSRFPLFTLKHMHAILMERKTDEVQATKR